MVVTKPFDPQNAIDDLNQDISSTLTLINCVEACGYDKSGYQHEEDRECENWQYDPVTNDGYCSVMELGRLQRRVSELDWLNNLMGHFWKNGVGWEGLDMLQHERFVHKYEYEQRDNAIIFWPHAES